MASFVATIVTTWLSHLPLSHILPAILAEAALIFLSANFIERRLLKEMDSMGSERAQRLTEDVKDSIDKYFRSRFDVLKYSNQYNVSLLPPRRSAKKNREVAYSMIVEAIDRANCVKILCTSAADIFPPSSSGNMVREKIREKATQSDPFTIDILACDPDGDYARIRGKLENSVTPNYVKDDLEASQRTVREIGAGAGEHFSCNWYSYRFMPQAWFLLTDHEAFVELYHFGLERRAPMDPFSCIGGRVPLLHAKEGSGLYEAMREYFHFLIQTNTDHEKELIRTEFFGVRSVPSASWPSAHSPAEQPEHQIDAGTGPIPGIVSHR